MRRVSLMTIAAVLLGLGLGIVTWRIALAPTVLRVAVGPGGSDDAGDRLETARTRHL